MAMQRWHGPVQVHCATSIEARQVRIFITVWNADRTDRSTYQSVGDFTHAPTKADIRSALHNLSASMHAWLRSGGIEVGPELARMLRHARRGTPSPVAYRQKTPIKI